jgi:hypothetical protein
MIQVQPREESTTTSRWRIVVLMVVVTIFAAEAIARAATPLLVAPSRWPTDQISAKAAQIQEASRSGSSVDVVFLGSSVVALGIDPVAFNDEEDSLVAFNAALNGASVRGMERWTADVVVPVLNPTIAVIGVITRDLNDRNLSAAEFLQTMAVADGWRDFDERNALEQILDNIRDSSAFLRLRPLLRTPATTLRRTFEGGLVQEEVGPFGSEAAAGAPRPYQFNEWRSQWRNNHLNDYVIGGTELEALDRLVASLVSQHIEVWVVEMPIHPDYLRVQPGGNEALDEFHGLIQDLTTAHNVSLVDMRSDFGANSFRDPAHLDQLAARELADRLHSLLDGDN